MTATQSLSALATHFDMELDRGENSVTFRRGNGHDEDATERLCVRVIMDDDEPTFVMAESGSIPMKLTYAYSLESAISAIEKWLPEERAESMPAIERPRYH